MHEAWKATYHDDVVDQRFADLGLDVFDLAGDVRCGEFSFPPPAFFFVGEARGGFRDLLALLLGESNRGFSLSNAATPGISVGGVPAATAAAAFAAASAAAAAISDDRAL
jgi:hypothetical protein